MNFAVSGRDAVCHKHTLSRLRKHIYAIVGAGIEGTNPKLLNLLFQKKSGLVFSAFYVCHNYMKYFRVLSLVIASFCLLGMTGGQQQAVVVPNVEGVSLELAAHMLQNVGLQSEGRPAVLTSLVVRQYPRPGFEVLEGTVVTLFTE
jgi:hypothetical protein